MKTQNIFLKKLDKRHLKEKEFEKLGLKKQMKVLEKVEKLRLKDKEHEKKALET